MSDQNIIYSTIISSTVAELITLPISTVQTIYQTDNINVKQIVKKLYVNHGIMGFYNSSIPAISSQIVSMTSKYYFYYLVKKYRETQNNDIYNNIINGFIGGNIGGIISHPLDVIKYYKQKNLHFVQDLKIYGPKLFFRGYTQTIIKNSLLYGILFPSYDYIKISCNLKTYQATTIIPILTSLIIHPFDLAKTRLSLNYPVICGFNIKYYYKGYFLNISRTIPHFTINMMILEYLTG